MTFIDEDSKHKRKFIIPVDKKSEKEIKDSIKKLMSLYKKEVPMSPEIFIPERTEEPDYS